MFSLGGLKFTLNDERRATPVGIGYVPQVHEEGLTFGRWMRADSNV